MGGIGINVSGMGIQNLPCNIMIVLDGVKNIEQKTLSANSNSNTLAY